MATTTKNSKLTQVEINSQDSTTGAITTTEFEGDGVDISVEVSDEFQDPEGQTVYTVSRLPASIPIFDYDAAFTSTMNNGDTIEDAMTGTSKVFVRVTLEGGVIETPDGSQWLEVRPVISPDMDGGTDSDLVVGMFEFQHSEFDGVQRPV